MSLNLKDIVGNIFYTEEIEKEENEKQVENFKKAMRDVFGANTSRANNAYNPFLKSDGSLFNPNLNYQGMLDSDHISKVTKNYISQATGLSPTIKFNTVTAVAPSSEQATSTSVQTTPTSDSYSEHTKSSNVNFNANLDSKNLASLDVMNELPKLSETQIADIISKHFSKSTVINPSDAKGIYEAQQKTGMSALAILSIGALESGYGTSNIAKQKNNIWGWGATNSNPSGNAKSFSAMKQGASEFANSYMKTYYNGYGAKSIYSAGTGNNPSGKGYSYYNDGTIEKEWATKVGSIMENFYNTAKSNTGTAPSTNTNTQTSTNSKGNSSIANKVGQRIVETYNYPDNGAARGQCVWYVRNRMKQKFGKETGAIGNGNQMWYNAKSSSKVAAKPENLKGDMILSYKYGTSAAGQKYGHVIYIEDVVGDTVYYTESGSGYYRNKTDGVVKTATRKGILEGVNSNGGRIGSVAIGLIDVTKY